MNTQAGISSLAQMQFRPCGDTDASTMILTDLAGRQDSYLIDQTVLGTLLHQVLGLAADQWQHKPELALETVNSLLQSFPEQEAVSILPINQSDCAIKINLGKIQMAFLIPATSADEDED